MEQIVIRNLGVGALLIEAGDRRVLVDAFNTLMDPDDVLTGDILLFTHDDGDHFCVEKIPEVKGQSITIVGPPTIIKSILLQGKANIEQIDVLYTNSFAEPASVAYGDIKITCYHTQHFNHWNPLHNSYLIEALDMRLYITGDSLLTKELAERVGETDAVICNLVEEGYLNGNEEAEVAAQYNLSYLLKVRSLVQTKRVIGIHLLDFGQTVDACEMKRLVLTYGFHDIFIPVNAEERFIIEKTDTQHCC